MLSLFTKTVNTTLDMTRITYGLDIFFFPFLSSVVGPWQLEIICYFIFDSVISLNSTF